MVRSILQLFGKSPFGPLQSHMRKVYECTQQIRPLFDALISQDKEQVSAINDTLGRLEHEADEIKTGIRRELPHKLFLPVDRRDLLDLLGAQDAIADQAQDLGVLLNLRWMEVHEPLREPLDTLVSRALDVATEANRLMDELDELVETSFSGPEAEKVLTIIDSLEKLEHRCDESEWVFARAVFAMESKLTAGELWMWLKIGNKLGDIADSSERVGKRLQLMLHK